MGKIILIKGADFSKVSVEKVKLIIDKFNISVFSNSEELGTVTGGGIYEDGDVVTLSAIPNTDCEFVEWDDGVTDATRTIIAGENVKTSYTAIFRGWILGTKKLIPKNFYYGPVTMYMNEQASANIAGKTISKIFLRIGSINSSEEFKDIVDTTLDIGIGYCDWNYEDETVEKNKVVLTRIESIYSNVVKEFEPVTIPIGKRFWFRIYIKKEKTSLASFEEDYITCSQYSQQNDGNLSNNTTLKPLIDFM